MPLPSALGGIKEIRINWKSILHDDFSLLDDNHLLSKQQTFGVKVYKKVKAYIIIMLTFFSKRSFGNKPLDANSYAYRIIFR